MQYVKKENGFEELPQKNVDFGGGLERLLAAVENKSDIFQTSLFTPIIKAIEERKKKNLKIKKRMKNYCRSFNCLRFYYRSRNYSFKKRTRIYFKKINKKRL